MEIEFIRLEPASSIAFWSRRSPEHRGYPTTEVSFEADDIQHGRLQSSWSVTALDKRVGIYKVTSRGDRDDWITAESDGETVLTAFPTEVVKLGAHEAEAAFSYADVHSLLTNAQITELPEPTEVTSTSDTYTFRDAGVIDRLAARLSFIRGGDELRIVVERTSKRILLAERMFRGACIESARLVIEHGVPS